jgi:thiamine biosynthesis protein ThiS
VRRTALRIYVNGETRELTEEISLQALIETLGFGPARVAAELNGLVVSRSEWSRTTLEEGDKVEIVHFVGGGA